MTEFLRRHAASVTRAIHGFDRLRFRGTWRRIANAAGLGSFLHHCGVLLKDAGAWMEAKADPQGAQNAPLRSERRRPRSDHHHPGRPRRRRSDADEGGVKSSRPEKILRDCGTEEVIEKKFCRR
jgi:hypothetical protein